ncbi:MAG TPA: SBBP repeat-containing protein, partial [Candidatus Saccharimonadales bacterium]|nr:SBBP repeat-containing protein [Candidatus Saccharimonadales bacterium]
LIKLTPAADSILFSTYAGGNGDDFGLGLAVDSAGSVYAIGDTNSTDLVTVNALQPFNAGGFDAFLAKLTPAGTGIVFATYAGGNADDSGQAIALDASANIYAAGFTSSTNLQLIVNAVQPIKGAGYDAFLAKLNTSGTSIIYSTFLGGNNTDAAYAIAADGAGNVYVTGETSSTNFHLVNPLRNSNAGGRDVFVTKLNASGNAILFSTYLGGSADDIANAIAADNSGIAYVTGRTGSINFSTSNPIQPTLRGGIDAFVSKINTTAPSSASNTVQFNATGATVTETLNATTKIDITVTRTGDTSGAASIDYASFDGTASERSDYLAALGRLTFDPGQTSRTITVFIVDDRFGEGPETFTVNLSTPIGCTFGSPSTFTVTINSNEAVNGANPVKDASFNTDFFVRQHYLDFFNREPDAGGLAFWKDQIDSCTTQECREIRRINVSAAFFLSIEFQQTGYLVERLYKTAYGSAIGSSTLGGTHQVPVPIVRLNEFLPDTQQIGKGVVIGQAGAEQILENNKQVLIAQFVQRPRFTTAYPTSISPAQFVDTLNANAGGVLSQ